MSRCSRLPKGLKEWPAYEALQKKIDDFNETCPLLEMMANKSMLPRHWKRIEAVTNCQINVYADGFLLKNLMELPLLEHKEDIEVSLSNSQEQFSILEALYRFRPIRCRVFPAES